MSHPMIREITNIERNKPRASRGSDDLPNPEQIEKSLLEKVRLQRQSIIDAFYTEFFRQCVDVDTDKPLLAKDEYIRTADEGGVTVDKSH